MILIYTDKYISSKLTMISIKYQIIIKNLIKHYDFDNGCDNGSRYK